MEYFQGMESLLMNEAFVLSNRENRDYSGLFIEYSNAVQDPGNVFAYLREQGIGQSDYRVHLSEAFFLERNRRAFKETN